MIIQKPSYLLSHVSSVFVPCLRHWCLHITVSMLLLSLMYRISAIMIVRCLLHGCPFLPSPLSYISTVSIFILLCLCWISFHSVFRCPDSFTTIFLHVPANLPCLCRSFFCHYQISTAVVPIYPDISSDTTIFPCVSDVAIVDPLSSSCVFYHRCPSLPADIVLILRCRRHHVPPASFTFSFPLLYWFWYACSSSLFSFCTSMIYFSHSALILSLLSALISLIRFYLFDLILFIQSNIVSLVQSNTI